MARVLRVLLVDDHLLFRRGVKALLAGQADVQLAGEASSYAQAMQFLRGNSCDVVVADLSMPGRDGLDLLDSLKTTFPKLHILVLTMHGEEEYATRAIRSGAGGFLTKDVTEEELIDAIRRVADGQTVITPKVAEVVALQLRRKPGAQASLASLSAREFTIYRMLAEGMRVSSIARELNLSIKTVSTYKIRLQEKLGLHSQFDIVRHYLHRFGDEQGRTLPSEQQ